MTNRVRVGIAMAANVGALALSLTGSAWLWVRASESVDRPALVPALPPVVDEVVVPFAADPRLKSPLEPRAQNRSRPATRSPRAARPVRRVVVRTAPRRSTAQPVVQATTRRRAPRRVQRPRRSTPAPAPAQPQPPAPPEEPPVPLPVEPPPESPPPDDDDDDEDREDRGGGGGGDDDDDGGGGGDDDDDGGDDDD